MQLACPTCHTAFLVDPPALGKEGRTVRCARCRTTWFARPEDLMPVPEMAEAAAEFEVAVRAPEPAPSPPLPQVVAWDDTVMVDVRDSPPLAPIVADRPAADDAGPVAVHHWTVSRRRAATKQATMQARLFAVAVILGAIVVGGITSRANIVRMVPDLAGFYAAIGLPVNLRGLEFRGVKTTHEVHDGIAVLIIDGEIVNVARQTVEVPRLRLAVMGANGQEVYSWTTLLPHSILPAGETLPFRSRLASPPADGKEVVVRFLNRTDLTAN